MHTHTPGPWKVRQSYHKGEPDNLVIHAGTLDIAEVYPDDDGKERIDAALIAAAPALLEALKGCMEDLREALAKLEEHGIDTGDFEINAHDYRNAIAQAERTVQ
jgi:hypothetical protein